MTQSFLASGVSAMPWVGVLGGSTLQFIQGMGHIIPGLEHELYDMKVGQTKNITVTATIDPAKLRDAGVEAMGGKSRHRLEARGVACWFGANQVLDDVHLEMRPREVTALIGPSGCGKSTFLRTLNRMHELVPGAALAGAVFR